MNTSRWGYPRDKTKWWDGRGWSIRQYYFCNGKTNYLEICNNTKMTYGMIELWSVILKSKKM
jgi:hypothetical protein